MIHEFYISLRKKYIKTGTEEQTKNSPCVFGAIFLEQIVVK